MSEKASQYRLKVTAGPSYDPATHQEVPVNEDKTLHISNEHAATNLTVRIQNYTGFPNGAPRSNPYFDHPDHSKDQYSISFGIAFKKPINGNDLVFGNDFDRPIRDRLPPGFNGALRVAQWTIDPTLDGDAYADKPYLYSPALATWNRLRVGKKEKLPDVQGIVEEGEEDGVDVRSAKGVPEDVNGRRSYFQNEERRKEWEFEEGRVYYADFGNQYLDFNEFTLRLPGFNINALHYIDEKTHSLRYVLKSRTSGEVYLVVLFTLVHASDGHDDESTESKENGSRFEWEAEPSADDVE
ncbi:hypothetical protein AN5207.2 [Aspergillus nidulans FGSC A4]|uniref:Domain of unknown function at the cortex 1 domain-containing protein n=1 Tax=Emericella nidulans (strain FGSC A4 / ATCC 38163 / CBS 112.46 / NRRL 194 / M139) TaxID=227321 RepID=Q5B2M3_EMENI|nr:hypothetical protein [Aspergillus nidulans FGSC A4]EAA62388.1 hypothetical protein AN5207.2 [Aspergillus nidulans FGSC A4]CBF81081.1 TPA: conserved hypothetical protein [Aspergillus nidulans FGSC A4]|eukprot:XP_662811.1 hypothetical protein AN5207.2 [Aspergillus nidulans FGSC A4]